MSNLTLFVLGHEKEAIKNTCSLIKEQPNLKVVPVNLEDCDLSNYPEHYNTKLLSENRFFLSDWNVETEYVGAISYAWPEKYDFNLNLLSKKVLQGISENKVIAPATTSADHWLKMTEKCHAGMMPYLEELASFMNYDKKWKSEPTFWCNSFFCHRDVFFNFVKNWRLMFDFLNIRYKMNFNFNCVEKYSDKERKPAYLLERATMMHFAESSFQVIQYNQQKFNL